MNGRETRISHADFEHLLPDAAYPGRGLTQFPDHQSLSITCDFGQKSILVLEVPVGCSRRYSGQARGLVERKAFWSLLSNQAQRRSFEEAFKSP